MKAHAHAHTQRRTRINTQRHDKNSMPNFTACVSASAQINAVFLLIRWRFQHHFIFWLVISRTLSLNVFFWYLLVSLLNFRMTLLSHCQIISKQQLLLLLYRTRFTQQNVHTMILCVPTNSSSSSITTTTQLIWFFLVRAHARERV